MRSLIRIEMPCDRIGQAPVLEPSLKWSLELALRLPFIRLRRNTSAHTWTLSVLVWEDRRVSLAGSGGLRRHRGQCVRRPHEAGDGPCALNHQQDRRQGLSFASQEDGEQPGLRARDDDEGIYPAASTMASRERVRRERVSGRMRAALRESLLVCVGRRIFFFRRPVVD